MNDSRIRLMRFSMLIAAGILLTVVPAHAQDAAGVYKAKCAACHGADGKGNTTVGKQLGAHDFASPEVAKESDEDLIAIVTKGKNKMPAYGSSLKEPQIKDLIGYVRSLAKKG
jgi:cytochrome c6